jgi:hypothetical protein
MLASRMPRIMPHAVTRWREAGWGVAHQVGGGALPTRSGGPARKKAEASDMPAVGTAMKKLRIVILGFGTARQKMALE